MEEFVTLKIIIGKCLRKLIRKCVENEIKCILIHRGTVAWGIYSFSSYALQPINQHHVLYSISQTVLFSAHTSFSIMNPICVFMFEVFSFNRIQFKKFINVNAAIVWSLFAAGFSCNINHAVWRATKFVWFFKNFQSLICNQFYTLN